MSLKMSFVILVAASYMVQPVHAEKSTVKIRFAPMRIKVGNETILLVYSL